MSSNSAIEDPLDKERNTCALAIGEALTQWAWLESTLCSLFAYCTNVHNTMPAYYAFWSIVAFDSKLTMTDAVVNHSLKDKSDMLSDWASLEKRLRKKAKIRNKIAHGSLVTWGNALSLKAFNERDVFLVPFMWSKINKREHIGTKDGYPDGRYYSRDIERYAKEFYSLNTELTAFTNRTFEAMLN